MDTNKNKELGDIITQLINNKELSQDDAYKAFSMVLKNEVSEMQQGAFLASLTSKGPSAAEVAGGWRAVYELDTNKVDLNGMDLVDNCGTGMDSFKTFNISTAASLVAAAGGVKIARHGARAISSSCGTVDMAESLGVDMECHVSLVAKSIEQVGIGLFNGMSPHVHPNALGRILSQIHFGSPLNVVASLAHPALPKIAVRGVYSPTLLQPVAEVMKEIGYTDALVVYGAINGVSKGMDEASVCGESSIAHLSGGEIETYTIKPDEVGLQVHNAGALAADPDRETATSKMYQLLSGKGDKARLEAVILNSGLIFYTRKTVSSIKEGVEKAKDILFSGSGLAILKRWVEVQNMNPELGLQKLARIEQAGALK